MDKNSNTKAGAKTGSATRRKPCAADARTPARRLADAQAQQAAVNEILRVMADSPADVKVVLDAIAKEAAQLCRAPFARVTVLQDGLLHPLAGYALDVKQPPALTVPATRTSIQGRALLERRTIHYADVVPLLEREFPDARENARIMGFRAVLAVPLLWGEEGLGAIFLYRRKRGLFAPDEVTLVETFARQAAIALSSVRQFHATQEALDQQTATSEILRVISSSPTDVIPVFETIAASALRLCDGRSSAIFRFDGELIHLAAHRNLDTPGAEALGAAYPAVPSQGSPSRRAILTGRVVHIADVVADAEYTHPHVAKAAGFRSVLSVPMLRGGQPIGTITVYRNVVSLFPDSQVALLQTFADQAVIAIENTSLFTELGHRNDELSEALEQQTATSEILRVISRSQIDVQPVFETIAENALRLCDGVFSAVYRFDGELIHVGALRNITPEGDAAFNKAYPCPPSRGGTTQRAILTRSIVHMPDVRDDPEYSYHDVAEAAGFRSVLSVPMLRDGEPIGTVTVYRDVARPFPQAQIELLKTFADQAVIAVENVRLFTELESRNAALTESLEQQTATSDILRAISQSPTDVQPVFDTIAKAALELCRAASANVFTFDGKLVHLAAFVNVDTAYVEALQTFYPRPLGRDTAVLRAIQSRGVVVIPDVLEDNDYVPVIGTPAIAGRFRSILAVPLMREGKAIGGIAVGRPDAGNFPESQVALLQTFADQAVIAIENVRLFNELDARNRDLTEALEQQTATSDILRVISQSPTDVKPVFDTIAAAAMKLCGASNVNVFTFDGELIQMAALVNLSPAGAEALRGLWPQRPSRGLAAGRAILTGKVVEIPDVLEDPDFSARGVAVVGNFRSILAVPLAREGHPIGAIAVGRPEPGPFPDSQGALLETFADQAVIAIENVRLFTELDARNRDLTEALEQQTATSDILRVISRSRTDVQPVFEAIAGAALKLCEATSGSLFTFDGELVHIGALVNANPATVDAMRRLFPRPPSRDLGATRAVLTCNVVVIADVLADPDFAVTDVAVSGGYRSVLAVPLVREGRAIGSIAVGRPQPGAFSDTQVSLLQTFADQAVIAIENVRLFTELEARTAQLTRSVGELRALGEVGQAVSSTLDLGTVLSTIVARATELTGMDGGSIYEYDEAREEFHVHTSDRLPDEMVHALRAGPIRKGEGALGRMALTGEPIQIRDITVDKSYQSRVRDVLLRLGYRSLLAVPLMRDESLLGGLVVNRKSPGDFDPQVIELLKTFATQSAIAIQNARLFREIEIKSRELETASRHKSEFLANMSHELRTPLNAIIGFSEVLTERLFGEMNAKQTEYVADIADSGRHLLDLINDILDLSKIEAGRMELDVSDFDLPRSIGQTLSLVRERAQRHGIVLDSTIDPGVGTVRGDQRKVKQVLLNLLSNALKFTPESGRIDVGAVAFDDRVEVSVADTGVGIAPEDQEAVFEEFRQVGANAAKIGGTGLGLAISRKFIELHGGRLWLASEVGKGSRFTFSLPADGARG